MTGGGAKQVARYGALIALFLIPLTPLIVANSLFFPFITGKALYFRILIDVAVCAWAALALMDKAYRPRFSWIMVIVLAFVAWMFVADCFAINAVKAFWSNFERMEGWVLLIHLLAFFFAASNVLRVEKQWRNWFLASLAVSVIVIIHAFFQLAGWSQIHQGANRIDASFGNSAYLAVYFLFNTFLALWLALTEQRAWLKWALIALAAISAILIFYTETRGTILGLTGGAALAALLFAITEGGRARRAALSVLAVIVIAIGGFFLVRNTALVQNNDILHRIASISPADGQVRFTLWHMAYEGALARPVTGYGQEGFNYVFEKYYDPSLYAQEPWFDRAHNAFIDWLVAGGVPAFLLYIALFLTAIVALWKSPSLSRAERIALTATLAGYACHNLFVFDNLYAYIYFFAVLALVDSQIGRPIAAFEREGQLKELGTTLVPIMAAAAIVIIGLVEYPGLSAAHELIVALSPQETGASGNLAAFEKLLTPPSFAGQEIREQLVSFATSAAASSQVTDADKQQIVSYAVSQMTLQTEAHPGDARSLLELSLAYRAGGDLADSLKAVQAAEAAAPAKEQIYIQEGAARWDLGDTAGAQTAFAKAYQLGPQFPQLAAYAAAGDFIIGNASGAQAILTQSYGTTTVDSDVLALAYYRTKDYADLIRLWQLRVSDPAATADTYYGLAAAYYIAGQKAAAIAEINATIAKFPDTAAEGAEVIKEIQSGVVPQ